MFGILYVIIGCVLLVVSITRKSFRDTSFKATDKNIDFPFWVDSSGNYRWKSNNQKIMAVTWNSEGHMIITDKHFNDIDWTMKKIENQLNINPNAVIQYGKDIHEKKMIPGIRYITKVNGQYRYYVAIHYGMMTYYMDIETERIVMPVPESLRYEEEAKAAGYEYCTEEQVQQGIIALNAMSTLKRRGHICYRGVSKGHFWENHYDQESRHKLIK